MNEIQIFNNNKLEKRIEILEKKVAELEGRVQEQLNIEVITEKINNEISKALDEII